MQTECRNDKLEFQVPGARPIVAEFNGGTITSDGGVLLLKEVEAKRQIIKQFAACLTDYRDPEKIEHPVEDLLAQRIYGLALGYEDLDDHDLIRKDPLLAAVVGKSDPCGEQRRRETDRGKEQQLELFADRTSTKYLKSNQTRLWFSSIAYVLMNEMRRLGLAETEIDQAQCSTIRLKLLKIGAQVQVTVRRLVVRLASSYPFQELFITICRRLRGLQELRI
jgi:Transposase DDE domain group 1